MTNKTSHISQEDLLKAYKIAARIVSEYGDTYLPIFERLHTELENHKASSSMKSLALQIASE